MSDFISRRVSRLACKGRPEAPGRLIYAETVEIDEAFIATS
jgi:hypothetical protein